MWRLFKRVVIGPESDPYLVRYILIKTPWGGLYLHHMIRSDYERALHDHPWDFTSVVLKGGYYELTGSNDPQQGKIICNLPGDVLHRTAAWKHRVILAKGKDGKLVKCWTLVFVHKKSRDWGFWITDTQWCWWRRHNAKLGICEDHEINGD